MTDFQDSKNQITLEFDNSEDDSDDECHFNESIVYEKGNYNPVYLEKLNQYLSHNQYTENEHGKDYTNFILKEETHDTEYECIVYFHYLINNDIDELIESFRKKTNDESDDICFYDIDIILNVIEGVRKTMNVENNEQHIGTTKKGVFILLYTPKGLMPVIIDDDGAKINFQVVDDNGNSIDKEMSTFSWKESTLCN